MTSNSSITSSNRHKYHNQQNSNVILLITRSQALALELQSVVHSIIESVEDLPLQSDVKAVVLGAEYARLGSFLYCCYLFVY